MKIDKAMTDSDFERWVGKEKRSTLYVGKYFKDKGSGLALLTTNKELSEEFKDLCWTTLHKDLHWFHQVDGDFFQFFECWSSMPVLLRDEAARIANKLGIKEVKEISRNAKGS